MTFGSVYVAGHRGLVGSALLRNLQKHGYRNLIVRTLNELDLRNTEIVREFFATNRPDAVVMAAARVGGIKANNDRPVDFLLENLQIQNNLISASFDFGVKKLLFLGSSCIYPRLAVQPIKEEALLAGALEPTNEPSAFGPEHVAAPANDSTLQCRRRRSGGARCDTKQSLAGAKQRSVCV